MNVSPKNPARLGAELSPNQTQIRIRETSHSNSSSGFLERADRSAAQYLPLCSPVPSVVIAFSIASKRLNRWSEVARLTTPHSRFTIGTQ